MRNLISYLFVVFSMFSAQLAQANSCETTSPVSVNDLKFIGVSLLKVRADAPIKNGYSCRVVKGNTDAAAKANGCSGQNEIRVNPGNPQYITGHGRTPSTNEIGYYFCMTGFSKREMCNHMKVVKKDSLIIAYTGKQNSNDGNCMCRPLGTNASEAFECTSEKVAAIENVTGCAEGLFKDSESNCVCENKRDQIAKTKEDCPKEIPVQVTETVDDKDFEECFSEIKAAKEACSEKGQAALAKCSKDSPEVNKNINEAQRVLSIGLDAIIAKNAGTGALATCAKMGAAGTTIIEALSLLQENCKKEIDSCKKGCADVSAYKQIETSKMAEACKAKFEEKHRGSAKTWTPDHNARFAALAQTYKENAGNAEKFCKGNVQVADGQMNNFLTELAENVQKANICECQLTASSLNSGLTKTDKCEDIQTPLTCIQNVNQPGCSFSSVGCSPDSLLPNCRNPNVAINPNGSGVGMPASGFAGPGFGSASPGGANSGKTAVGAGDLSGLYDETRPSGSGTATADAGSPFAAAAPAGSPGGGAGPGGGSSEGGAAAGEEKDKGSLSGLFQSTKASIASLFGGGPDNKGTGVKKPDNKAYKNDVNGFRPKATARGLANEGQFGGKNRDIWKTMNERYNDQYHTFITVENPPK